MRYTQCHHNNNNDTPPHGTQIIERESHCDTTGDIVNLHKAPVH